MPNMDTRLTPEVGPFCPSPWQNGPCLLTVGSYSLLTEISKKYVKQPADK